MSVEIGDKVRVEGGKGGGFSGVVTLVEEHIVLVDDGCGMQWSVSKVGVGGRWLSKGGVAVFGNPEKAEQWRKAEKARRRN